MYLNQQTSIQKLKHASGWINGYTPNNGYVLGDKGYATISTSLVSVVKRHISHTSTATDTHPMVPLTTAPSQAPHIPPIINTNPSQAGAAFGIQGSRTPHQYTDNSVGNISSVSINGHS